MKIANTKTQKHEDHKVRDGLFSSDEIERG
jgi:hypothetical protein